MPNSWILAGLVLMIAGVFSGRLFAVRAIKLLSPQEKLALLDSCSRLQVFGGLPLVVLFIGVSCVDYLPAGPGKGAAVSRAGVA